MIHICFNLDEKYVFPCKVLIQSIIRYTNEDITFHFIGIPKQKMETRGMKCKFYPNPDLSYFINDNLKDYYYFSKAAMYRLLIPFMIETDKALYMDIDMLVRDDIKNLYLNNVNYVGAVPDPCEIQHKTRLKLNSEHYYNSGLILFNSKNIREDFPDYKERILQAQKDFILDLKDQDIFNIVFKENITTLDYKWNIDSYNLKEKTESKKTSILKDKAYRQPSIVHCMGKNKWWNLEGMNFGTEWDKNNIFKKQLHRNKRKEICGIEVITNY